MAFLISMVFGAIGSGYILYGKKQYDAPFLVAGFILCIYPWFVENIAVLVLIGVIVSAAPFVTQRLA